MRHRMAGRKLGRTTSHRWAMLRNIATSLFRHERITTTVAKAKELRPFAEKLITLAKKETLHARRQVLRHIKDREVVAKLFGTLGPRYATRPGGYSRIVRTSPRRGDSAEMAIIELIDTSAPVSSQKKKTAAGKKARKGAAPTRKPVRRGTARQEALADVAAAEEIKEEAEEAEETAEGETGAEPAEKEEKPEEQAEAKAGESAAAEPAEEGEKAKKPKAKEKKENKKE
jgi:large subunit ribosomal protein L17